MDQVLGEDRWKFCLCYIDDVIIYSDSLEEHLKHIQRVLAKFEEAGLTVNPSKAQLCLQKINYLGMVMKRASILQPG